jgi:hypothetical protein
MTYSDIHSTFSLGAPPHLTNNTIIKITWKNDEPIWTEQWPLTKEKLQAAKELIDEQLELKHIEESCSPWNSAIFVIKKKKKKKKNHPLFPLLLFSFFLPCLKTVGLGL